METITHKYFPKRFKYIKQKVVSHIIDGLESSSNDSNEE